MKEKATICLNMIVRDESSVIRRCLDSVKPLIDYWVIVDTGSNDGTQEIIQETLKDIPGELHELPWKNFAHNRTEALALAKGKGDFALLIDADEQVVIEKGFLPPDKNEQVYITDIHYKTAVFHRELFVNNHLEWYWEGILHEQIYCRSKLEKVIVAKNVYNLSTPDGNRSMNPRKYQIDAELLEKAILEEPENARHVFYLAQSYACAEDWASALKNYERRVKMGGWNQEVYYSLYAKGYMQDRMGVDMHERIDSYAKAYQYRPTRAEPLFRIASIYFTSGHYALARIVAKFGMVIERPSDSMFVEPAIYQFGLRMLYADCCRALDERQEAIKEYETVTRSEFLPSEVLCDVLQNIALLKALPPREIVQDSIPYC